MSKRQSRSGRPTARKRRRPNVTAARVNRTNGLQQAKRVAALNIAARAKGWPGISEFLTAVKNAQIELSQKPGTTGPFVGD